MMHHCKHDCNGQGPENLTRSFTAWQPLRGWQMSFESDTKWWSTIQCLVFVSFQSSIAFIISHTLEIHAFMNRDLGVGLLIRRVFQ